jgi:hypothetical protein
MTANRYGKASDRVVPYNAHILQRYGDLDCGTEHQRRSAFYYFVFIILTIGTWLSACSLVAMAADRLTQEEIAKLEPELCKEGSISFRALTGALPTLTGSPTRDMTPEQIALIDQFKFSGRRKVWILRVPAAFITSRTCDAGRKNWTGEGDELRVSQIYDLDGLLLDDRVIAKTRATNEETSVGIAVKVTLHNHVIDPQKLSQIYLDKPWVIGRAAVFGPPTCHEQSSSIAGLVEFKRIDANVRSPSDCGSPRRSVFARKSAEGQYDFVADCVANCIVSRDYEGWSVEYSYNLSHLENWQFIHARIKKLLDEWTTYIDRDS